MFRVGIMEEANQVSKSRSLALSISLSLCKGGAILVVAAAVEHPTTTMVLFLTSQNTVRVLLRAFVCRCTLRVLIQLLWEYTGVLQFMLNAELIVCLFKSCQHVRRIYELH